MSGSRRYHQKCVCGAEIDLVDNYDFISSSDFEDYFENWAEEHSGCLKLFHDIQKLRASKIIEDQKRLKTG